MTFTRYTTKTIYSGKKDILSLPFEEIEHKFNERKEALVEEELANLNVVAKKEHERVLARVRQHIHAEQEDDSATDFEPITDLSDEDLVKILKPLNGEIISEFVEKYGIKDAWSWLGPQLLAHLGNYKLPDLVDGKIRPLKFLELNIRGKDRELGLWRMLTKVSRGNLMEKQTAEHHLPVCALVPLYMAAQKQFNSVAYSKWDTDGLSYIVDKDLYEAMTSPEPQGKHDVEELISIREAGLTYTSTAKGSRGESKQYNPASYHRLVGITESGIGNLNNYARAMLTQIWCAHPQNRSSFMILNPYNWDEVPNLLIPPQVQISKPSGLVLGAKKREWL